jgi:hypothetical protein
MGLEVRAVVLEVRRMIFILKLESARLGKAVGLAEVGHSLFAGEQEVDAGLAAKNSAVPLLLNTLPLVPP